MADTSRRSRLPRAAAVLGAAALALTGCGGGGDSDDVKTSATATALPTPSTTVDVPEGTDVTPPGTTLSFGDTATVAHEDGKQGTVLGLRVDSAQRAPKKDFKGFNLDDPYKRRGNYYYVRVTVTNRGEETVSGLPVPLWGVSGDNTLLQAVRFTSAFDKCPTEDLPKKFAPDDRFRTCLVYLSPNKGSLAGVSYRPTESYVPIEWRGKVEPATGRGSKGSRGSKNTEKQSGSGGGSKPKQKTRHQ